MGRACRCSRRRSRVRGSGSPRRTPAQGQSTGVQGGGAWRRPPRPQLCLSDPDGDKPQNGQPFTGFGQRATRGSRSAGRGPCRKGPRSCPRGPLETIGVRRKRGFDRRLRSFFRPPLRVLLAFTSGVHERRRAPFGGLRLRNRAVKLTTKRGQSRAARRSGWRRERRGRDAVCKAKDKDPAGVHLRGKFRSSRPWSSLSVIARWRTLLGSAGPQRKSLYG